MILRKYLAHYNNLLCKSHFLDFLKMKYATYPVEWSGHDTNITVYNSAAKRKVPFKTIRNKTVSWYCCGPTVYDSAHIGNFCSYMRFDVIRRIMMNYFGLNVIMAMNITDIDDKIINKANELNVDYKCVSEVYEREFLENLKRFNIMSPTIIAKVTDHMPDIIEFISDLVKNSYGYVTPDGSVYFSVNKYGGYGIFQPPQEEQVIQELKECSQDFALWKSAKPGEPFWRSPWGNGRPGWHIECSTLACKFLGKRIDLHSGGVDLKFPHHENEEAQCCARYGLAQWVNYWMHSGHLSTKDDKMSKSLKNTISVNEFLNSYTCNNLRTLCLMVPYRNNIEFRPETIEKAIAIDKKLTHFICDINAYLKGEGKTRGKIDETILYQEIENSQRVIKDSLSNDFDTSRVMSELLRLISTTNSMLEAPNEVLVSNSPHCLAAVLNFIQTTLENLGYSFTSKESTLNVTVEEVINSTIDFRNKVRKTALGITKKDSKELLERKEILLSACDALREDLLKNGIELKDRKDTTSWTFVDYKSAFFNTARKNS